MGVSFPALVTISCDILWRRIGGQLCESNAFGIRNNTAGKEAIEITKHKITIRQAEVKYFLSAMLYMLNRGQAKLIMIKGTGIARCCFQVVGMMRAVAKKSMASMSANAK